MPVSEDPVTPIKSVELSLTSKIDVKGIRRLLGSSTDFFRGMELERSMNLSMEGFRLQVKHSEPGTGIVTPETEIVLSFTPRKLPHCYVIALDTSYSMKKRDFQPTRYGAALNALEAFFRRKTGSGEPVGVVEYGINWDVVREAEPLKKKDAAMAREALEERKPQGKASIADAVAAICEVYEVLDPRDTLKLGVILSDGVDDGQSRLPQLLDKSRKDNIIINTIFMGDVEDTVSAGILRRIADETGGTHLWSKDARELEKGLVSIATRTSLTLMSPAKTLDAGETEESTITAGKEEQEDSASDGPPVETPVTQQVKDDDDGTTRTGTDGDENEKKEEKKSRESGKGQDEGTGDDKGSSTEDETVIRVEGPPPSRLQRSKRRSHRTMTFVEALKKLKDKLY